jgi:hypothetical protein
LPGFPASAKQQIRIDIGPDLLLGRDGRFASATLPRASEAQRSC